MALLGQPEVFKCGTVWMTTGRLAQGSLSPNLAHLPHEQMILQANSQNQSAPNEVNRSEM